MNENMMYFSVSMAALVFTVIAGIIAYVMVRPYRSDERVAAIKANQNAELYFSGRVLRKIPWQFWTSFAILVLLVLGYFLSAGFGKTDGAASFMELIKYVTGAVVGSLFFKGNEQKAGDETF
jgi:ABC-type Fe3+ transport system permease subunit